VGRDRESIASNEGSRERGRGEIRHWAKEWAARGRKYEVGRCAVAVREWAGG